MQEDQKEAVKLFFEQSMKSARETKNLKMVWTLEQCKAIVDAQTDDELITAYARAAHMGGIFFNISGYFQLSCKKPEDYLTSLISNLEITEEAKKTEVSTKFWEIHKDYAYLALMFKLPEQQSNT